MLNRLSPLVHILTALIAPVWWAAISDTTLSPGLLILCGLFGLLPDIDTATSHVGRLLPEVALAIERRWGHRTITHSLGAVLLVALITLPLTGQWLLTAAYASHILLDMLVGGNRGVALCWPLRYRFSLGHIQPASPAELAIGLLALALVVIPLLAPALAIQATAIIPQEPTPTATATPVPTLVTIRVDHVYEVEAEILIAVGDQVTQGQQVANLRHWRATLQAPPPTPSPTHTWLLLPTLTPSATPTPYVPPTVSPLVLGAAWAELKMARFQATLAAAPPDATAIARVCDEVPDMQSRLEAMRNGLWSDQLKRDAARLRGQDFAALEATLFEQERLIAEQVQRIAQQEQTCAAIQTQPHQAGPEELEIAAAQLQRAEIRYVQAIATPTRLPTPTATPTRTPTATPTPWMPPSDESTRIYALVAGDIYAVTITGVTGNEARVEIDIAIGYGMPGAAPAAPSPNLSRGGGSNPSPGSGEGWGEGGEPAIVTHVRDGDTIEVRFSDGREEAIRLLDVNTPETVKPNAPVECYGPEASHYTKERLCGDPTSKSCTGVEVQLELAPERDRYNRLLGYIWFEGALFNEELASLGLAYFNDYGNPHQYTARIEAAAAAAQNAGVGLWGMCPTK